MTEQGDDERILAEKVLWIAVVGVIALVLVWAVVKVIQWMF